mmetsp:Transcript_9946/g.35056  ORF Transcript_9946/g.35056 Transcript_9946/m.35056 type:complete len:250 (-) Transcript_9946:1394-2143(-)
MYNVYARTSRASSHETAHAPDWTESPEPSPEVDRPLGLNDGLLGMRLEKALKLGCPARSEWLGLGPDFPPWLRRTRSTAPWRSNVASCRGVRPQRSRAFTSAPFSSSSATVETWPSMAATWRAVRWSWAMDVLTSAPWPRTWATWATSFRRAASRSCCEATVAGSLLPASTRSSATASWPSRSASSNALKPKRSVCSTDAPRSMSRRTHAVWPSAAAICRRVRSSGRAMFTSAPSSSARSSESRRPSRA